MASELILTIISELIIKTNMYLADYVTFSSFIKKIGLRSYYETVTVTCCKVSISLSAFLIVHLGQFLVLLMESMLSGDVGSGLGFLAGHMNALFLCRWVPPFVSTLLRPWLCWAWCLDDHCCSAVVLFNLPKDLLLL